jgi:hypothetical protein
MNAATADVPMTAALLRRLRATGGLAGRADRLGGGIGTG